MSRAVNAIAASRWITPAMLCLVGYLGHAAPVRAQNPSGASRSPGEVISAARDSEWRDLDPENTLYVDLPGGRVILELAPDFAPRHVENIKAMVRGGFFDGAPIIRSQDNYVVQWGIEHPESLPGHIASTLPPEFEVLGVDLPFARLPDGDVYAPAAGFVRGFPAGRDPDAGITWMAHCYGVVGVARGNDPESGSGAALYVVIGQAPRHLDRNLAMVGRVVRGMEYLSALPRGVGPLGMYASRSDWTFLQSVRLESDVPADDRTPMQVLRTDSQSFRDLIVASRSRQEEFFVHRSDRIDLCRVPLPSRSVGSG